MKDLGELNYLGIQVTKNATSLLLSQSKYVDDLLAKVNMQDSMIYSTHMASRSLLNKTDGVSFSNVSLYRSTVGAFQYVTPTS